MSKRKVTKATGSGFTVMESGILKVAHPTTNPTEPWTKAKIPNYLGAVVHSLAIDDKHEYEARLKELETEFNLLVRQLGEAKKSLAIVLQGRDGAGKTGATKRLTDALGYDFKLFKSVPIGPPSSEELSHDFLWRFHKYDNMPAHGQVRVYDRSWAERVLVERVMELTPEEKLRASYSHINTFEWLMTEGGTVVVKLWLDITKGEQAKRFKARAKQAPWKISDSDGVARAHWKEYTPAANEMFHRTGTSYAPWFIISSEDKRYSRISVLTVINQQLREALGTTAK